MGADIVTVSTDTQYVHLAWQRHEKELAEVKYVMGADPTGNLARMFGVYDESSGLALRGTFIINPAGILMNSEVNFYNMGRNIDELLRKLKRICISRKRRTKVAHGNGRKRAIKPSSRPLTWWERFTKRCTNSRQTAVCCENACDTSITGCQRPILSGWADLFCRDQQ
jgi:alkyl hydroperoxide reductase subunit AhpC